MATLESCLKTAGVDLRILFDSVENCGVFDIVGESRPGSSESVSPLAKQANQRLTVLMVVVPSPNLLLMFRAADVAPMPQRHSWRMIARSCSCVIDIVIKVKEGPRLYIRLVEKFQECSTTATWCDIGSAKMESSGIFEKWVTRRSVQPNNLEDCVNCGKLNVESSKM
ncbi:hypothetical protein RB195_022579 [Necator americanus]|uniref:Uncharacterized protein n=1 Tax=Necator americanus TaxID=51031 RepID=A0ABR1EFV5_NECAM